MIAAVYARKSTTQAGREDEDKSVARQVANARAFAEARGWRVDDAHVYTDDGVSGAAELRKLPAKQQLLAAINSGRPPFQVLVTQAPDRLSRRDGDEAIGELKAITARGVAVWFYADGTPFRFGTFADNTLSFLRAEFAAEYRRACSAKTREALVRKAQLGHVTGGRVFGYDNARVNSHSERVVNEREAAVVRQVYRLYAAGAGLPTIAHTLNAEGAPHPRAQQGRPDGWCPSSVREVLRRPLYRGEIVYGRAKKRAPDGHVRPTRRPESEWLRVPAPHLRIVPPDVAAAVDARFAGQRQRALRLHDGRLMGRPPGEGSPYLLTGLLTCGVCGGSLEVLSSGAGGGTRRFNYRCSVARRKGPAACGNRLAAPMGDTDEAVLAAIEDTLLHPAVVQRALAHAEAILLSDRTGEQRAALEAQFAETAGAIRRLTAAIAQGGELASLVAALENAERQRQEVEARLQALRAPRAEYDAASVRERLAGYLADWRGLLRGHVQQAQQVVRRLVKGRLTMVPQAGAYYTFSGTGTVRPVLAGDVRKLASLAGFEPAIFALKGRRVGPATLQGLLERESQRGPHIEVGPPGIEPGTP